MGTRTERKTLTSLAIHALNLNGVEVDFSFVAWGAHPRPWGNPRPRVHCFVVDIAGRRPRCAPR